MRESDKKIIELYRGGDSYDDIAIKLEMKRATVASRLFKLRHIHSVNIPYRSESYKALLIRHSKRKTKHVD